MDTIHTFDPLLVKLDSFEGPLDSFCFSWIKKRFCQQTRYYTALLAMIIFLM